MTTLRRLMVADYPIRLFLIALVAWGVTADVCAQSPVRVGYYDMVAGAGIAEQAAPIAAAGFTPVLLTNVTAADLGGLHILFVQNPSTSGYGAEYRASALGAIQDAVNAGLVLIIHDRSLNAGVAPESGTRFILPRNVNPMVGFPTITPASSINLSVSDATTLVANGPRGTITDTTLDNGNSSNMGSVNLTLLNIQGRKSLLYAASGNATANAVTFSYPLGLGFVIYSSIPLDMFLKDMGTATATVRAAFREIYAPNVLTYAACGLKALPTTVAAAAATGYYGGSATFSAAVRCGMLPVAGIAVSFKLKGVPVGSAQTDASGTATVSNVSLGAAAASAIAAGNYPAAVSASFTGTSQYGASSGAAPLTVEKAPATITVTGGNFVYDGAPHAAAGSVAGVFGEPLGVPAFTYTDAEGATTDAAPVNAGIYGIDASVSETANYLQTSNSSTKIRIARASLAVAADNKAKIYGAPVPALTASYDGFVGNEDTAGLAGTLRLTTAATGASPVGTYEITPSGLTSINYDITFVTGVLAVTPASLRIRADNKDRLVGTANPPLTVAYEGFVLADTEDKLYRRPTVNTPALITSPDGTYPIVVSGAADANYTIQEVNGQLTVTPEGRLSGSGFVNAVGVKHHFEFDIRETIAQGEKASLTLRIGHDGAADDIFVSQLIAVVTFRNNPGIIPGGKAVADSVTLLGTGLWNGQSATFEASATDKGEPGVGSDTISVVVRVGGQTVSTTHGVLNGGNIQSNRLPGR